MALRNRARRAGNRHPDVYKRQMMLNAQFVEAVGMTMEEITDIDSYTEYL